MGGYIHERENWPKFRWNDEALAAKPRRIDRLGLGKRYLIARAACTQ
jgi:hypothetical protein